MDLDTLPLLTLSIGLLDLPRFSWIHLSSNANMTLASLPNELLTSVLESLELVDLLKCRNICSDMKALVDGTTSLQYSIELAAAGKVDSPASHLPTTERLRRLRASELGWSHLRWARQQSQVVLSGVGLWDISGNVLANTGQDSVMFTPMSLGARGSLISPGWTIDLPSAADFSMSASHDLLVKVEVVSSSHPQNSTFHIHLLDMRNGKPHLDAAVPLLRLVVEGKPGPWQFDIEFAGDFVGVMFVHSGEEAYNRLAIWNWRIGEEYPGLFDEDLDGFAFIDDRYVIASFIPAWKEYYTLRAFERPQLGLHIYSFADSRGCPMPRKVGSLLYPEVHDTASVFQGVSFKNPVTSGPALGQASAPFYTAQHERLYTFQFELKAMTDADDALLLVSCVPASVLRAHILQMETASGESIAPVSVPWQAWGPSGSRLFVQGGRGPRNTLDGYMYRLYGARYASCSAESAADGKSMLRITVHDFSQKGFWHSLQKAHKGAVEDGWAYHADDDGTHIPYMDTIAEVLDSTVPLETTLPYRSTSRLIEPPDGVDARKCIIMLSEDSVVIVCDDDMQDRLWMQVLTI